VKGGARENRPPRRVIVREKEKSPKTKVREKANPTRKESYRIIGSL
jgi:hypothetical protein